MSRPGRNFLLACAATVVAVVATWPTMRSLARIWDDTEVLSYTHGYVVAALVVWLVWRARHRIEQAPVRACWLGIAATALASVAWYVAWASGLEVVHQALLPLMLLAAVAGAAGSGAARALAYPVGYLYFAIPVWSLVNGQLQSLTTFGVTLIVRATGLTAHVDGNMVRVPAGTFEIAGGCSGLHFLIVALAVAALQGEIESARLRTRLALLATAGAMAIAMNWVRVYGIILNGYLTDMRGYLVAVDHYVYGWVLFAVLMGLYFWISSRYLLGNAAVIAAPSSFTDRPRGPPIQRGALVATLAALGLAPGLTAVADSQRDDGGPVEVVPPRGAGGWFGPHAVDTEWTPAYPDADGHAMATYEANDRQVTVYLNAYRYQAQGHEVIGSANDLLRGIAATAANRVVVSEEERPRYVQLQAIDDAGVAHVIGYFYMVAGRPFHEELPSKLYYAMAALQGAAPTGIVAVRSSCEAGCDAAVTAVHDYLAANASGLASSITSGGARP